MGKFVFLGVDLSTVNWSYVFYIVLSIAVIIGAVTKLYPMGTERAVIVAIGFTMVLYFYSLRWFGADPANDKNVWPPHINTCPDYLTYIPPNQFGLSKGGCVDMIGVSTNGSFPKITNEIEQRNTITSTKVFGGSAAPITSANITDVKLACNACQQAGLTWEGIYDGDTCGSSKYESNSGSASSSGSGNCSV